MEMNFTDDDRRLVERLTRRRKLRRDITASVLILLGIALLIYVTIIMKLPIKTEIRVTRDAVLVRAGSRTAEETVVHIDGVLEEYLAQDKRSFRGTIVIEGINDDHAQDSTYFSFNQRDSYGMTGYIGYRTQEDEIISYASIRMEGDFEHFVIWNSLGAAGTPQFAVVTPAEYALATFDTMMNGDPAASWARPALVKLEYDRTYAEGLQ